MRLFRRNARPSPTDRIVPEFGVQVTLRKGDKIVRRDTRGVIHVTRVTEDCIELADLGPRTPATRAPRRG
jgi:hypothetical protein